MNGPRGTNKSIRIESDKHSTMVNRKDKNWIEVRFPCLEINSN